MDLFTGKLLWPDTLPQPPQYPSLEEDITCDVLIIGGGVAGALCGYYLMKQGVNAVLVDKRSIGAGTTAANSGILQCSNDKSLTSCIHSFGEQNGVRFYQLCRDAVNELGRICAELDLDAEYLKRSCLYVASQENDLASLRKEYELLHRYGFSVSYWEEEQISRSFSFHKPGAIYSEGDAVFNPYKLANGLIEILSRKFGLRVYTDTEIRSHVAYENHLVFHTRTRRTITAAKAVIATGYEAQMMKRNPNAMLESTFAVATQRLKAFPGWYEQCLIWETARPYLYIRTTADNRIIIGGMDEATANAQERDAMLLRKKELLLAETIKLFPELGRLQAEYSWSATFGSTHDGLPLIGTQEEFPHCYFALGYGGNGTVYCTIAGQIISSLIASGSHPDAHLFRFDRPSRQLSYS
ncbi:NAD(P)/FAD-dependent oxidoreductase [Paenibacillus sp. OAS669]|uniref:NAD(P)/FAD-dependent oxidoreductase n=1 Tax=Paenibacillus sp. OAS669 TaxID=2663821 RepID=UPI00178B76E3|nr:FAD-dependent oxidoreductase [Paenibacillus sp. OAS669]MBE1441996.1 glycine/D-amino acid oxidase-like deaminating enzyme [Paenibacillus sp. OAS669]